MFVGSIPRTRVFDLRVPLAALFAAMIIAAMTAIQIPTHLFSLLSDTEVSAGNYLMGQYDLTEAEAIAALSLQSDASFTARQLKVDLQERFLTAKVDPVTGDLTVHVTDTGAAEAARSAGANPVIVEPLQGISEAASSLRQALAELNLSSFFVAVEATKNGLYVELPSSTSEIVVTQVESFGSNLGVPLEIVLTEAPQLAHSDTENHEHIRAGQKIYYVGDGTRYCTGGFNLKSDSDSSSYYLITAGHCNPDSGEFRLSSRVIGETVERSAPESGGLSEGDWRIVENANPAIQPRSTVYNNETVQIDSVMNPVVLGATVCQTGATTGTYCGEIEASRNVGELNEQFLTDICETDEGDSGGAVYTPEGEAVGIISGSRPCSWDNPGTSGTSMAILDNHLDYKIY